MAVQARTPQSCDRWSDALRIPSASPFREMQKRMHREDKGRKAGGFDSTLGTGIRTRNEETRGIICRKEAG